MQPDSFRTPMESAQQKLNFTTRRIEEVHVFHAVFMRHPF